MQINKKEHIVISVLSLVLIFLFIYISFFKGECIFKNIFHIPCPACGMTRSFILIFQGRIIEAFSYNILSPIILLLIITSYLTYIYDLIFKKQVLTKILNFFVKHYYILIILIIISFIVNIYRGI